MRERVSTRQIHLFHALEEGAAARREALPLPRRPRALGLAEALANARRQLAGQSAAPQPSLHGGSRPGAHLPGKPGGPEIYALCPGCEVHPGGGIYPADELVRAEGCHTGRQMSAARDSYGERECRQAEWEGSARPGTERRDAPLPSGSPAFLHTEPRALIPRAGREGGAGPAARVLFLLTAPWRLGEGLVADVRRRLRRAWYFRRRRAICRRRLSRIVSSPSWTS